MTCWWSAPDRPGSPPPWRRGGCAPTPRCCWSTRRRSRGTRPAATRRARTAPTSRPRPGRGAGPARRRRSRPPGGGPRAGRLPADPRAAAALPAGAGGGRRAGPSQLGGAAGGPGRPAGGGGHRRGRGGGRGVAGEPARPNWVVPREVLDARLVAAATAAGVELRRARVRRLEQRDGLVLVDGELAARVVVGADGANSTVRRLLGAPSNPDRALAIAVRGYAPAPPGPPEQLIAWVAEGWPA